MQMSSRDSASGELNPERYGMPIPRGIVPGCKLRQVESRDVWHANEHPGCNFRRVASRGSVVWEKLCGVGEAVWWSSVVWEKLWESSGKA